MDSITLFSESGLKANKEQTDVGVWSKTFRVEDKPTTLLIVRKSDNSYTVANGTAVKVLANTTTLPEAIEAANDYLTHDLYVHANKLMVGSGVVASK